MKFRRKNNRKIFHKISVSVKISRLLNFYSFQLKRVTWADEAQRSSHKLKKKLCVLGLPYF